MKFWKNLAQVFFGIIIGYVIARIMHIVLAFSSIPLLVQALSITNGESGSVLGAIVSLGMILAGFVVAIAIGIISNFLLIAFIPIPGVVSSCTSAVMTLYLLLRVVLAS